VIAARVLSGAEGRRMFRTLTVRENLMVAAQSRRNGSGPGWSLARVFALFPRLAERHAQVAGSLSAASSRCSPSARADGHRACC